MKATIKSYDSFNHRRFGNPWVAIKTETGLEFDIDGQKVGGYTGGWNEGEEGELFINDPQEGATYVYGQKDYRGNKGDRGEVMYYGGEFVAL